MNAFLLNLGTETLHLRMERHCQNALKVAKYLSEHPAVAWVNYPGLEESPYRPLVEKYLNGRGSGAISFGIRGGREQAAQFMNRLKLAAIVVHVADARTSVLHPASSTHRQMTDEQLKAAGIGPDLIRMSIGIENSIDIINDLAQAF